jgi:hypothetical protein
MPAKWMIFVCALALITTVLNAAIFVGQLSSPVSARAAGSNASKLLDDDDFVEGVSKLVRKTVRDYCTVGKRDGIDC